MTLNARIAAAALLASLLVSLVSCGDNASNPGLAGNSSGQASAASATVNATTTSPTTSEAARFLTQATFGPSDADIDEVMASGYAAWINTQQQMKPTAPSRPYFEMREAQINVDPTKHAGVDQLAEGFWRQAATDRDQLRLRTTFALSQIFVISGQDGLVGYHTRAIPDYWDMLHANAFGNFRVLLEKVTLHPEMGLYLGVLGNDKGDRVASYK